MANVKISDLPAASSAAGTDQLETNQGGTSRRLTVAQVATHVRSTATDTVVVAAGSAAAPSISPTGDSNTGLFAPAADTLAFSTGGTERLRLDSSGNATFAGTAAMASSFLRNRIINGDMRIDQRNAGAASGNTVNGYFLDRWAVFQSVTGKLIAQQNAGSVTPPSGFTNYLGVTSQSAYSVGSSDFYVIDQRVEGFNVSDLGWGTASARPVTLSFWVRSSLTGTFGAGLRNASENRSYPFTYTISAANTWEYKTVTIPGDTSGTWGAGNGIGIELLIGLGVGTAVSGPAGAWAGANYLGATGATSVVSTNGATFYLTGVQLEVGTAATPFERRQYGQELLLCQRYFQQVGAGWTGMEENANQFSMTTPFWVTMRAAPTSSLISTSILTRIPSISTDRTIAGCSIAAIDSSTYAIWVFFNCSGGNVSGRFIQNRNGGNILNASAEL